MIKTLTIIGIVGLAAMLLSGCAGQNVEAIADALSKDKASVCVTSTMTVAGFSHAIQVIRVGEGATTPPVCK